MKPKVKELYISTHVKFFTEVYLPGKKEKRRIENLELIKTPDTGNPPPNKPCTSYLSSKNSLLG